MKARTTTPLFFLLLLWPTSGFAQGSFLPLWTYTWPYGQEDPWYVRPSHYDNHVCVDPAQGNVYLTIDDGQSLVSPHWEYLHTFASDGTDLTAIPVPLVGNWTDALFPSYNHDGTQNIVADDGDLLRINGRGSTAWSGRREAIRLYRSDTVAWSLDLGRDYCGNSQSFDRHTDAVFDSLGIVIGGTVKGNEAWLCSVDRSGLLQWERSYPGSDPIAEVVVLNNVIYASIGGTIHGMDRNNGQNVVQIILSNFNGFPVELATDGTELYFAYVTNEIHWGKRTGGGGVIWDQQMPIPPSWPYPMELRVDGTGRTWFSYNALDGGHMVVTSADGTLVQQFTYGASINDLDLDLTLNQAYLTGWVDTIGTSTYLTAFNTDLNVGRYEEPGTTGISIHPQPAVDVLHLTTNAPLRSITILDATGRVVRSSNGTVRVFDVSDLSAGFYSLRAETEVGPLSRMFVVAGR